MSSVRRIVSLLFGVLLMFSVTQIYFTLKQNIVNEELVKQDADQFLQMVSKQGRITKNHMNDFLNQLSKTGNLYDIKLCHERLCQEPEYRFRTLEEILAAQNAAYDGDNFYTYHQVISEKPEVKQQEPVGLTMNEETNSSILEKYKAEPHSSTSHVHTPDCYESNNSSTKIYVKLHSSSQYIAYDITNTYDIYCDHCGNILYTFKTKMNSNGSGEQVELICYGLDGNPNSSIGTLSYNTYPETNTGYGEKADHFIKAMYDMFHSLTETEMRKTDDVLYESYWWDKYYIWETTWAELEQRMNQKGYQGPFFVDGNRLGILDYCPYACEKSHMTTTCSCHGTLEMVGYYGEDYEVELAENLGTCYIQSYYSGTQINGAKSNSAVRWTIYRCDTCGDYVLIVYYPNEVGYYKSSHPYYNLSYLVSLRKTGYDSVEDIIAYLKGMKSRIANKELIHYSDWNGSGYIYGSFSEKAVWDEIGEYLKEMNHAQVILTQDSPYYMFPSMRTYTNPSYGYHCNGIEIHSNCQFIDRDITSAEVGTTSTVFNLAKHYDMSQGKCMCDQIIVSITPTHPVQNIYLGDQEHLITTATITYLDGSTEVKICDCSFQVNKVGMNQTAVITYYGLYCSNQSKIFSSTLMINVVAKSKTCKNGHSYWLSEDGSDPGCPFCRAWLKSLALVYPANGALVITQDTTLETAGVTLKAIYLDGREEYVTSGYLHNFDSFYIGVQNVTIGYKGFYVYLHVKVICKQKQCTICGNYYDLYPDGRDPGCPYCLTKIPVFTGKVMTYYTETAMDKIKRELELSGQYPLSRGDSITMLIHNKNKTFTSELLGFFGYKNCVDISIWDNAEVRETYSN